MGGIDGRRCCDLGVCRGNLRGGLWRDSSRGSNDGSTLFGVDRGRRDGQHIV